MLKKQESVCKYWSARESILEREATNEKDTGIILESVGKLFSMIFPVF